MIRNLFSSALLAAALACAAQAADETYDQQMARLGRGMPKDVVDYIPRLAGCTHWGGEYGGDDAERTRQINEAMTKLGCDRVQADYVELGRRHAANPTVIDRLNQIMAELGGGDLSN